MGQKVVVTVVAEKTQPGKGNAQNVLLHGTSTHNKSCWLWEVECSTNLQFDCFRQKFKKSPPEGYIEKPIVFKAKERETDKSPPTSTRASGGVSWRCVWRIPKPETSR